MSKYLISLVQAFITTIIAIIVEVLITNEINKAFVLLIFSLSHVYFIIHNEKEKD